MIKFSLLSKKKVFDRFLQETDYALSVFSFVSIFTWKDFFTFRFKVIRDTLCIFAKNAVGTFLYLPPLGRCVTPQVLELCFKEMARVNKKRGVTRIENVEEKDLSLFPADKYNIFKKSEDFVYRRDDIASLRGKKYKSKRAVYHHFLRHYKYDFALYTLSMRKACLALYTQWAKERKNKYADDIYQQMIEESYKAHDLCLRFSKQLGLIGRVVFVDGRLSAYSFGFALKKDTFCVLLEVADVTIKGLPTYIFKEFCSDASTRAFTYVNVMDDFGLEAVRRTKMSFRPCQVHPCYVVSLKER